MTVTNADGLFRDCGLDRAGEVDNEIFCRLAGASVGPESAIARASSAVQPAPTCSTTAGDGALPLAARANAFRMQAVVSW